MTGFTFKKVSDERYHEMLEILPPVVWTSKGFLVGEAWTHRPDGAAAYSAFFRYRRQHYECNEPMTLAEFHAFDLAAIKTIGHAPDCDSNGKEEWSGSTWDEDPDN